MGEVWKEIKGYESKYWVSNIGRVYRKYRNGNTIVLRPRPGPYPNYSLYNKAVGKTYRAHRLVAEAFIEACPKNREVNHIDRNKFNNNAQNLEYVTHAENSAHASKLGLCLQGEKAPWSKLKNTDILRIKEEYAAGNTSQKVLAGKFKVCQMTICLILLGRTWRHV